MEWVQTTGKTIDEAKERALDELGVDDRDAEFEVLEEPRSGLFGLSRGDAKVRARVRPTTPRPKQERGRRRQGSGSGGGGGGNRSRGGRGRGGGGSGSGGSGGGGNRNERSDRNERNGARDDDAPKQERSGGSRGGNGGNGRGGGRNRDGGGERNRERSRERSRTDDRPKKDEGEPMSEASVKEQAEAAEAFLSGLVEAFGLSGTVTSEEVDDAVEVRIDGEDLGLLIGPKGRTLWALQELTKTVVQRQQGGGLSTRIRVDVAGYRERRKAALERFTQDAAAAVLESGQARALEPMGAADRKVVHDTVNDIDGVVFDLGSGGGLPALPCALADPSRSWVLIESQLRRADFLVSACRRLGLTDRVEVLHARAEEVGRERRASADVVTARSFGPPAVVAECAAPLLKVGGRLLVSEPPESADRWPADGLAALGLSPAETVEVDGLQFVTMTQTAACPATYPRRPGIPGKSPLF